MRRLSRIALSHVVLALALLAAPAAAYQAEVLARWRAGVLPTLDGIEPRRDGRAETWQRLYCLRWDDACVRCERARADEAPRCAPIDPGQPLEACQRQAIACEAEDFAVGPAVCQSQRRCAPSRAAPIRR
jgi:hypothetical protein